VESERAVGQVLETRGMVAPASRSVEALVVQPGVDRIRAALARVDRLPKLSEAVVVGPPAERARAMSGGKGGGLVEEEELREPAGLEQGTTLPAAEPELARDPPAAGVAAPDRSVLVVEAAAVAVDEPARGVGDELAEGSDAVLQRHRATIERSLLLALQGARGRR